MTVKGRLRARSRVLTIAAVVVSVGAVALACQESRRSLGEECIKNVDCLSEICLDQKCAAAPPILDRDAAVILPDATSDVVSEAAPDAPAEAAAEAGPDAAAD
jgi:hypothetical protein